MIIGLDVSTSIIGICSLSDNGSFISTKFVDLRKTSCFIEKVQKFVFAIKDLNCDRIFIEDKLSGFSAGKTMQQTMMKLATFNGAITYASFMHFHHKPLHIHPSTIKATMKSDGLFIPKGIKGKDKKRFTVDFVKSIIPEFPYEITKSGNLKVGIDDMADAYCVARAGFLKFCNE